VYPIPDTVICDAKGELSPEKPQTNKIPSTCDLLVQFSQATSKFLIFVIYTVKVNSSGLVKYRFTDLSVSLSVCPGA